jgi:hypothetical protein
VPSASLAAVLLVVALAGSCPRRAHDGVAPGPTTFETVSIRKAWCGGWGTCRSFDLLIDREGHVRFTGHGYSSYWSEIPARNAGLIGDAIDRARFFEIDDRGDSCSSVDGTVTRIAVRRGGEERAIVYTSGCDSTPSDLLWLADVIPYLAEAERWIGVEPRRRPPGW